VTSIRKKGQKKQSKSYNFLFAVGKILKDLTTMQSFLVGIAHKRRKRLYFEKETKIRKKEEK
jgi:hypothetical protein